MSNIAKLLETNVNDHVEKKMNLSYLSWAWAWTTALQADPTATWEVKLFQETGSTVPYLSINGTAMVFVTATMFGKAMTCQLPVMDHRNKAILNPDAFAVNTAIMRCLAKSLALHGLGLYIYSGEDLPSEAPLDTDTLDKLASELVQLHEENLTIDACKVFHSSKLTTSNEAREYLWNQLKDHPSLRSAIKANKG